MDDAAQYADTGLEEERSQTFNYRTPLHEDQAPTYPNTNLNIFFGTC